MSADSLAALVRTIPDFPKPGIQFRDITTLLADAAGLAELVGRMEAHAGPLDPAFIVGIEARGFILASPVAYHFGAGFVPVRKKDKLPWETESADYALEYGTATLEVHRDAVTPGERVLIVDDVLATGGTAAATAQLVDRIGGKVIGIACLIELGFLNGRDKLEGHDLFSLITF